MEEEMQYKLSSDSKGNLLEGGKFYLLHLPPKIPACKFWSVLVYDSQSSLIIKTEQSWPSIHSNCKKLAYNLDGSVDIWFGHKCTAGKEYNWIQTIPGKSWYLVLRLYEPTDACLNNTWKPGKIEEIM